MRKDIPDVIDLLLKRAPELHAAGVTSISIDGFAVTLERPPSPVVTDARGIVDGDDEPPPNIDPLNDPSTYPGGKVPGFKRPQKE